MNPTALAPIIAPRGTLRAVINLGNPVLTTGTPLDPGGVTVDLARGLADWLGVPVELTCVQAAREAFGAITEGRVDMCFLAIEPAREEYLAFTAPYVLIEGVFAVAEASRDTTSSEVDRAGVRIAVAEGSAYDLFLTRTIKNAELVRTDDPTAAFDEQGLEVCAGVRQPMTAHVRSRQMRILEPPFMDIRQAMGLPRTVDAEAVRSVAVWLEEQKSSGAVANALRRSGVDATVAPAGHTA